MDSQERLLVNALCLLQSFEKYWMANFLSGCTLYRDVLVEEVNEHDASLMTGRMSNNMLVHFPGDASLIGKLVTVDLEDCRGFYYMGHKI